MGILLSGAIVQAEASEPDPLIRDLKAPGGFELTLFAKPPDVRYPTCLSSAIDGVVYVGIDENGSIDAEPGRGRIIRCVDTDLDGKADRFETFAKVDSPRGLIASGRKLYVLHPPDLSVYHDEDGNGISERSDVLVKGIGHDLKFRGADHTTNGIRLGIDGYLYIAVGDYGFTHAEGTDGKALSLRGGGVVRVRTDGRGLEIVSRGQRNIYDVAIDPFMNLFTRDNTNDGGGWDVRLSHVSPLCHYGYPSLFQNFPEEIVPPLADYGGGSPTGSLFVDDSLLPNPVQSTLLTCDWGRGAVYRHPLEVSGSSFKAGQETFLAVPRPTDIDIDGSGSLYVASWHEGGYVYSGPNVGYVLKLLPLGKKPDPLPRFDDLDDDRLIEWLGTDRQVLRIEAQRVILAGSKPEEVARRLEALAGSPKYTLQARCAAVFTLGLSMGKRAIAPLLRLADDPDLKESALRAISDRKLDGAEIPADMFVKALDDPNPRVRLVAVVALGRLGSVEFVSALLARTADSDPLVAKTAIEALRMLGPAVVEPLAALLSSKGDQPVVAIGRVLETIHEPRVVSALIEALKADLPKSSKAAILSALCRLGYQEADWKGDWWGTRPDTSGPYFKPLPWPETNRIVEVLRDELKNAPPETARFLLAEMIRNKVDLDQVIPQALALASRDPSFNDDAIKLFDARSKLPEPAVIFLGKVVADPSQGASVRAHAASVLLKRVSHEHVRPALIQALAPVGIADDPPGELLSAWQDFRLEPRNIREAERFAKLASEEDPGKAALADAVLLSALANPRWKDVAEAAINKGWSTPKGTYPLLIAIGRTGSRAYDDQVRARLTDADADVRKGAVFASNQLGLEGTSTAPTVASLGYEAVVDAIAKAEGDPKLGARLFERQNCVRCHTVVKGEAVKGPYLGGIGARYNRKELAEAILKPSAKIAQGFETQKFATTNGENLNGFVVRESGESVEVRDGNGALTVLPKAEIEERKRLDVSMMPNGLADPLTVRELASILAYLESLKP